MQRAPHIPTLTQTSHVMSMRSRILLVLLALLITAIAVFYLTAPRPTDLHVRVIDAASRLPIAAASVEVQQRGEAALKPRSTDDEGETRFLDMVPDARYRVRVQKVDYALAQAYNLEVPAGETTVVTLTLEFLPGQRLYVGLDSGHVAELDTASLQVPRVWLLPNESGTVRTLLYNPALDRLYAATTRNVHMLGAALGEQRGLLDITGSVGSLALSEDGQQVYVVSTISGRTEYVTLDARTGERLDEVTMRYNSPGVEVVKKPGSQAVYTLDSTDRNLWLLDLETQTVLHKTPLGFRPELAAVSVDGRSLYVTSRHDDELAVVSTIVDSVARSVPIAAGTSALAVSEDGATLCVANRRLGTLTLFDTGSWQAPRVIATGREPVAITFSKGPVPAEEDEGSAWAYVANSGDQTISVIYLPTEIVFHTVRVPGQPASLAAREQP